MARLVWTEPALQDLEQIADYIALDDPKAAKELVRKVFEKTSLLEEFPEMHSKPRDLPNSRYRHLVLNPLRIFHRYDGETVYIVYVMRSERILQKKIFKDRES